MIFDKELMFVENDGVELKNLETGQLGEVVDLGAPNQGRGRLGFVALAFNRDTTATGDPEISFALSTSETEDFAEAVTIPLSLPSPLKKEGMAEGAILAAPIPRTGLLRYVKLMLTAESPIACTGMEAGFVLDADELG